VKHPQEIKLHQRLLRGDYTASEEITEFYLAPLVKFITARNRTIDKEIIWDACTEALFNYLKNPSTFDPGLASLITFFQMAVKRDLLNLLRKTNKLQTVPIENVALLEKVGNNSLEEDFISKEEATTKIIEFKQKRTQTIKSSATSDTEAKFMALMLEGEKKTAVYAELLGITGLPQADQKRLVKQHKDKLRLRIKRKQNSTGAV
jgi:hypothetical protein